MSHKDDGKRLDSADIVLNLRIVGGEAGAIIASVEHPQSGRRWHGQLRDCTHDAGQPEGPEPWEYPEGEEVTP